MVVTDPTSFPSDHVDAAVVGDIRDGVEAPFADLVRELGPGLERAAQMYVSDALAEEAVQDTWIAVIDAIDRFEGRSSLKTWIYRILLNKVRTLAGREARVAASAALGPEPEFSSPAPSPVHDAGYWPAPPDRLATIPGEGLERQETLDLVAATIERLPPAQREVVELRDVQGWSATDTADALGITDANQRVLLHRGRTAIRSAIAASSDDR